VVVVVMVVVVDWESIEDGGDYKDEKGMEDKRER
jgi:hypothetical protein